MYFKTLKCLCTRKMQRRDLCYMKSNAWKSIRMMIKLTASQWHFVRVERPLWYGNKIKFCIIMPNWYLFLEFHCYLFICTLRIYTVTWQLISKANFDNLICLNLPNWLRYYFHEKVRQILHLCHCYLLKGLWFAFCGWFSALRKSDCNF